MKKVVGIALVALLAVACSKKEESANKESNIMLVEPKADTTSEEVKEEAKEEPKAEKEAATTEVKEEATETKKEEEKETTK